MKTFYWIVILDFLVIALFRGTFVDEKEAVRALENAGYSEVQVIDHAWFMIPVRGGSENDAARFEAICKNPIGKKVTVYVFVGWPFKGATIRNL